MLFIDDKKYTDVDIASLWLAEHEGVVEDFKTNVSAWIEEWKEKNHADFAYYKDVDFMNTIKEKAKNNCIQKIKTTVENKFTSTLNRKKQKRLNEYRRSLQYKYDCTEAMQQNAEYQILFSKDYQNSSIFKQVYNDVTKEKQDSFTQRVIEVVEEEMKEIVIEEAFKFIKKMNLEERIQKLNLSEVVLDEIKNELTSKLIYYHGSFLYPHMNDLLPIADKYVNYLLNKDLCRFMKGHSTFGSYIEKRIERRSPILRKAADMAPEFSEKFVKYIEDTFNVTTEFNNRLTETITKEWFIDCVLKNPIYCQYLLQEIEKEKTDRFIKESILERIPDNYIDLFPMARKMKRHFILHIGPTNSGKTYEAMQAFRNAQNAIYLAPLRLLAFEVYEDSNRLNCPCNMLTGEEDITIENATHTACTIEMANLHNHYDVCVIDEAQLLSDDERGGAWTSAILGIQADVIHICAAPSAEKILVDLITQCDDSYEVVKHERFVPLVIDEDGFSFPKSVKPHDALIVFSKKNVLFVAAELQKKNWKVSVIYGALPYESRIKEVERFMNGETDVVVSTDAIGMGMNLPIKRIIFLETEKFDGKEKRPLTEQEVKQIAGRAGRRGIYDVGYYTSEYKEKLIQNKLSTPSIDINKVYIGFPESLVSINEKLSALLKKWVEMPVSGIFVKQNLSEKISLAHMLEEVSSNKRLIYKFINIPFDTKNHELKSMWYQLFKIQEDGNTPESYYSRFLYTDSTCDSFSLDDLESEYKKSDLLYNYCRNFGFNGEKELIMSHKKYVAKLISIKLAKQNLTPRKCKCCKKIVPWNYPYGYCSKCYDELYGYDYDYF